MNELDLQAKGFVRGPDGQWRKPKNRPVDTGKPTVVELLAWGEPAKSDEAQKADSGRFLVRLTDVRTRLLDSDNLIGKFHVDCCRYAGLLPGDSAKEASIQIGQRKVRKGEEPHTEIIIERLTQ